jgi:hypothetical protein
MDYFFGYQIFILNIPWSNGQITLGFGELDEVSKFLEVLLTKLGSHYMSLFLNVVLVLLVYQLHQIEYAHKLSKHFPECA